MRFYGLLLLIGLLDSVAIIAARFHVESKKWSQLALSLLCFAAAGYVYVMLMGYATTAVINVLYIAFSTLVVTSAFYFIFKERVSLGQGVGIALVVIGISILEM